MPHVGLGVVVINFIFLAEFIVVVLAVFELVPCTVVSCCGMLPLCGRAPFAMCSKLFALPSSRSKRDTYQTTTPPAKVMTTNQGRAGWHVTRS